MSDVDIERIDEIVTAVSVWIGRNAVGAMEDLYERDALIELQRLGKLSKDLVAELAAIRDAGDEEIDDICRPYVSQHFQHIIENDEYMRDIAKARGQKIAEQVAEIECYEGMKEGVAIRLADIEKERDEAIGLLKWLVELDALETDLKEYAKNPTAKSAKRILELTAKREEK